MLSDFLLLETYYEGPETVRFYEDLAERYGIAPVKKALAAGHLIQRRIVCGPDCGRLIFRLSDKGRRRALKSV